MEPRRLDGSKALLRSQGNGFNGGQELPTNEYLIKLVAEACSHPPRSRDRQIELTKIYKFVVKSGQLWKEDTPYYHDALQQTWLYLCQDLEKYNPARASIITWLDHDLKRRLGHFYQQQVEEKAKFVLSSDKNTTELIENLSAPPNISPMLDETYAWTNSDANKVLRSTLFRERSDLSAQILILRRLPPDVTDWQTLAAEFELTPTEANDLPKFYSRKCQPLVREFGKSQGYL